MLRGNIAFRIWTLLENVLPFADQTSWAFIGCVSMEERSIHTVLAAKRFIQLSRTLIFRISDDPLSRYFSESENRTNANQDRLKESGLTEDAFIHRELLGPFGGFAEDIESFLSCNEAENLIFDITSMPKKVFFFLVKRLMRPGLRFRNILATYAEPRMYSDFALAENPQAWNTLPGFDPPRSVPDEKRVVIGIGYEPLGLPDLVMQGEFSGARTHLLFPFPTPPDRIQKNWQFAKELFPNPPSEPPNLHFEHVDGWNVPEVFDLLSRIGDDGQSHLMLAPFGPKPVSLAMALYASRYSSEENPTSAYYTQPTSYNPNYTTGIKHIGNKLAIHCYAIKRLGQLLY